MLSDRSRESKIALALEAQLVQQMSRGDKKALITFYENHIDLIYPYFYSQVGNIAEAEDLTSVTFIQATETVMKGEYIWHGEPLQTWLFTIANDILQERNRRLSNLPRIENMDSLLEAISSTSQKVAVPDTPIQDKEQTTLWGLVRKLSLAEQQALIMRHVYGLPYSEIARRLKRGEHATKQLHYRALKKLKRMAQDINLLINS